jgi:Icc-related predicted phosphoesterase
MRKIFKKFYLITLILFLSISYSYSGVLEKGPYLQNATQKSITICWVSSEEDIGCVKYGKDKKLKSKVKEKNKTRFHQIVLDKLTPETEYFYKISGDGYESEIYKFKTAPKENTPFKFVVFGDTRTRHNVHKTIVEKIISINPDFVINTGDLVANGENLSDWDMFFEINKELMKTIPYYPVLGNHERDSKNYFDFFALPEEERYYSFSWGNSHFIVLDSNGTYLKSKKQKDFLKNELEKNKDKKFIFVIFHHPPYSASEGRKMERENIRYHFCQILEQYKPDIVFNGHDHNYQHYFVKGTHYIVAGGGGAPIYKIETPDEGYLKGEEIENFCVVSISGEKLKMEVYRIDGSIIDELEINKE